MIDALAAELLTVHMIDGRVVQINPAQITQMIHPREAGNRALADEVNCVIRLADGGFVSTAETCEEVEMLLKRLEMQ